jgi:glucokinase
MSADGELIGVDVGGTKVAVATLAQGRLSESTLRLTDASSSARLIDEIAAAVGDTGGSNAAAVGVGVPSQVEFATGRVRASVHVPLSDVPLRDLLRERLGLPVFVDNDATVAALAEAFDAHGRNEVEDLVLLTLGTGVGGGLVLNGSVYRGATGAAGEVGHTIVAADLSAGAPPDRGFPQPGSVESLMSGTALDGLARRVAAQAPGSALARIAAEGREVDGHDAVEAAKSGDPEALGALRMIGERLGVAVANVINLFDPEVVAIGGGVSVAGDLLLEPAREVASRFVAPGALGDTEIRLARHGPQAGVLGAALLAAIELEAAGDRLAAGTREEATDA